MTKSESFNTLECDYCHKTLMQEDLYRTGLWVSLEGLTALTHNGKRVLLPLNEDDSVPSRDFCCMGHLEKFIHP